jgi:hypothetical protein
MKYLFVLGICSSLYALRDPFCVPHTTQWLCKALVKVADSDGGCALLVIQDKEYYVRKGDTIQDYKVMQILDRSVVLKSVQGNELKVVNVQ